MNRETKLGFAAFTLMLCAAYVIGYVCGSIHEGSLYRRQAVERGFAQWTNSVDGKATFVWKEAK